MNNGTPDIRKLHETGPLRSGAKRQLVNSIFFWFCLFVTSVAVIVLTVLLTTIAVQGWDGLSMDFLRNFGSRNPESAGIKAALWGSVWVCAVCGLVALPVGVATAIYLEEFASKNRLTSFIRTNISNLAGVPSIVYGIIGLTIFARMFGMPGVGTETEPGLTLGSTWYDTYYASDGTRLQRALADRNAAPTALTTGEDVMLVEETDVSEADPTPLPIRIVPDGFKSIHAVADPTPITLSIIDDDSPESGFGRLRKVESENPTVWEDARIYLTSGALNQTSLEASEQVNGRCLVVTDSTKATLLIPLSGDDDLVRNGMTAYTSRSVIPMVENSKAERPRPPKEINVQLGDGGEVIRDGSWLEFKVLNRLPTRYVLQRVTGDGDLQPLADWSMVHAKRRNTFVETGVKTITVSVVPDDSDALAPDKVLASDASAPMAGERNERRAWYYFQFPFGKGVLAGGLTLMLVILPIVIISSIEALRAVPNSLRQASLAMGATPWQTVRQVTLPASIPMIMTGSILAMSRAIGEAAPILVLGVALFITRTPENLMDQFTILPMQVYNWASRPQASFQELAASGIIILLVVLLTFNLLAIIIRQRLQKPLQ